VKSAPQRLQTLTHSPCFKAGTRKPGLAATAIGRPVGRLLVLVHAARRRLLLCNMDAGCKVFLRISREVFDTLLPRPIVLATYSLVAACRRNTNDYGA
jgi:hypothetical protein